MVLHLYRKNEISKHDTFMRHFPEGVPGCGGVPGGRPHEAAAQERGGGRRCTPAGGAGRPARLCPTTSPHHDSLPPRTSVVTDSCSATTHAHVQSVLILFVGCKWEFGKSTGRGEVRGEYGNSDVWVYGNVWVFVWALALVAKPHLFRVDWLSVIKEV